VFSVVGLLNLKIEKLVYGGDGLARIDSDGGKRKTVFVPFVLPGEEVEAEILEERPGFARARLVRLLEPAAERAEPVCPYFGTCGGCQYQHASYPAQIRYKAEILRETIARIAKIELPEIRTHAGEAYGYRNRTRMRVIPTSSGDNKFAVGYYRMGSHEFLPVRECPISSPLIVRAIGAVWTLAKTTAAPRGLVEIELFANGDDSALLAEFLVESSNDTSELRGFAEQLKSAMPEIVGVAALPRPRRESDDAVAAPELDANPVGQVTPLVGEPSLRYKVGEYSYRVSAGSFFQTNRFLTATLVELVTAGAAGKRALDLYAGVGLFTVPLAKAFERVMAVESSPVSYRDLCANPPSNVNAIESTTEAFLTRSGGPKPDFAVVDPPRAGLGRRTAVSLGRIAATTLIYVSCDPSTLARDLPHLFAGGYRITQAHLVDLFPQTFHMETVLRLER
jgi:23S rRNA (uracil1939-C5)-methyltransferase